MPAHTNSTREPRPAECAFDPGAPVVIVGAGRSGSTLLVRILDAHPDLSMKGETAFLLPRLWDAVWKNRFWYQWQTFTDTRPHTFHDYTAAIGDQNLEAERHRAAALTAHFMAGLIKADFASRFWGFKEIWNGSGAYQVPWEAYDGVFPHATWVHIVRHPLDFLGSYLSWNRCDRSLASLQGALDDWLSILHRSRERAATGRYFEVRYEDLKQSPRTTLEPLFDRLGITWSPECDNALKEKVLDSRRDRATEAVLFRHLKKSPELREMAAHYRYAFEDVSGPAAPTLIAPPATAPAPKAVRVTLGDCFRFGVVAVYMTLVLVLLLLTRRVSLQITPRKIARTALFPFRLLFRRGARPAAGPSQPVEAASNRRACA